MNRTRVMKICEEFGVRISECSDEICADAPKGMKFRSTGTSGVVACYDFGEKKYAWESIFDDVKMGLQEMTLSEKIMHGIIELREPYRSFMDGEDQ